MEPFEVRYRAVASRDPRFDGRFFTGVTSTGIYCRPVCPARTPARANVRFFAQAAAAEAAGFRACKRCRPEVSPDSPDWDVRADLAGRALRAIADGVVDRDGVEGLARALAVSPRHLHRVMLAELGASPLALARSRRARLARQLIDQTDLPLTDIAFAAGFGSIRTFNETMRQIYGAAPRALRTDEGRHDTGALTLRLRYRPPFDGRALLAFLGARAIAGVEAVSGDSYRRVVGDGTITLSLREDHVLLRVVGETNVGIGWIVHRARRLLDLDADPAAIGAILGEDPALAPRIRRAPGLRLPGCFDPFETMVRAILGQQVSVAAATTIAGRLVARHGEQLAAGDDGLTHRFPAPEVLATADLSGLGIPAARARTIAALAGAVADGAVRLDGAAEPADTAAALLEVPGIGPWTLAYAGMRVLRDPDAFPAGDLGIKVAAERTGLPTDARALTARAEAWRPWRAYAAMHLWNGLNEEDA